jgi:hypothetical protein
MGRRRHTAAVLRSLQCHLSGPATPAPTATAAATTVLPKFDADTNRSGDGRLATQGFGRRSTTQPPHFLPTQHREIVEFFNQEGFAVIAGALSEAEVAHLNGFFDRTQISHPAAWGLSEQRTWYQKNQGLIYSQPLLDHPELDRYTQHAGNYEVVCKLLGGEDRPRFAEMNFREAPEGAGHRAMNFHHDRADPGRLRREVYGVPDWVCAIHYLTECGPETPAFAVVPRSVRQDTLKDVLESRGAEYEEMPLYGAAGTCCLYDTATFHTRLDGRDSFGRMRRTMHQYYARGGWTEDGRGPAQTLTDWNVFPERLAASPDVRRC